MSCDLRRVQHSSEAGRSVAKLHPDRGVWPAPGVTSQRHQELETGGRGGRGDLQHPGELTRHRVLILT